VKDAMKPEESKVIKHHGDLLLGDQIFEITVVILLSMWCSYFN
jgi:hypothetical protein